MRKRRLALLLCLACLLPYVPNFQGISGAILRAEEQKVNAEYDLSESISMTEYWKDGELDLEHSLVTISSKEEFLLFLECREAYSSFSFEGVTFVQTQDIAISDLTFSYDFETKRIGVWENGEICGAIGYIEDDVEHNRNYTTTPFSFYKSLTGKKEVLPEEIGLDKACLQVFSGYKNTSFSGIYDGNDCKISGAWLSSGFEKGIFPTITEQGIVKNLTFDNCAFSINDFCDGAFLSQKNAGTVENCHFVDIAMLKKHEASGLIAVENSGDIVSCDAKNIVILEDGYLYTIKASGGLVGTMRQGSMKDCHVINEREATILNDGMLIGKVEITDSANVVIEGCSSRIEHLNVAVSNHEVGGIIGKGIISDGELLVKNCSSDLHADWDWVGFNIGGMVANLDCEKDGSIRIEECQSKGQIKTDDGVTIFGGMAAQIKGKGNVLVTDCFNGLHIVDDYQPMTMYSPNRVRGGMVGDMRIGTLRNCVNYGNLMNGNNTTCIEFNGYMYGGVVGSIYDCSKVRIENCYNRGAIKGCLVGGLVAEFWDSEEPEEKINPIENCVNLGYVEGDFVGIPDCPEFLGEETVEKLNLWVDDHPDENYLPWIIKEDGYVGFGFEDENALESWEDQMLTPSPAPTETPEPTETPASIETPEPMASPIVTASPIPTKTPEPIVTANPVPTKSPVSTKSPVPMASPVPTTSPVPTASLVPTMSPVIAETVSPAPTEKPLPTATSVSSTEVPSFLPTQVPPQGQIQEKEQVNLEVSGLKAEINKSGQVKLHWKKNIDASGYSIYRSTLKTKGFKKIKKLRQCTFTDRDVKTGMTYYYQVRAYKDGKKSDASVCEITVPLGKPLITLKKSHFSNGGKYLQVTLKKYDGTYAELYFLVPGKKYQKIKLSNQKISKLQGKFKIAYTKKNQKISCKVRTYKTIKGRKVYSCFSNVRKISL